VGFLKQERTGMEVNFLLMLVGVAGGLLAVIQLWSD
jgi:hypothetical protein